METDNVHVGNSKDILIPSKLLKLFGFESAVNIDIED